MSRATPLWQQALTWTVLIAAFGLMAMLSFQSERSRSPGAGLAGMLHLGKQFARHEQWLPQSKPMEGVGYDGQFFYYQAQDPLALRGAWQNLDSPAYRFQRMFYPLAAYLLSGGDKEALPGVMLGISLAAGLATYLIMCAWAMKLGAPPWWGLFYLCCYGLFFPMMAGLSEPVANLFLAAGLYLAWQGRARLAGLIWLFMALTKEYYLVLPLAAFFRAWWRKQAGKYWYLLPLTGGLAWQLYVYSRFDRFSFEQSQGNFTWPLAGVIGHLVETPYPSHIAFCVAFLAAVALCLYLLLRGPRRLDVWLYGLLLLVPVLAGHAIWQSEMGFLRVFSPVYLAYLLVLFKERSLLTALPGLGFLVNTGLQLMHM